MECSTVCLLRCVCVEVQHGVSGRVPHRVSGREQPGIYFLQIWPFWLECAECSMMEQSAGCTVCLVERSTVEGRVQHSVLSDAGRCA